MSGRTRSVAAVVQDGWDWFAASDPGLNRLRMAFRGVMAMGTSLGLEWLVARYGLGRASQDALMAAQALGDKVGRVVMIDPFAYLPRYFRLFLAGDFGRRAYEATFASPFGRWVTNQTLRGRRAAAESLTASFAETDHEAARRYIALYDEVGGVERFRGFAAPVEIAHGEKSFGAVRRSLALWADVLPRARVHRLEGAGHQSIAEAPAQTARVIFG